MTVLYVKTLMDEIRKLKERRRAFILAHNYQIPEVQEVADFVGDSLEMAIKAMEVDADVLIVMGVKFMAEVAKVLNPDKIVIHPEPFATCTLAEYADLESLRRIRERYPRAPLVMYINSSLEAKAMSDYVVTSASAAKLVSKLEDDLVLFGPDKNLAYFVRKRTGKEVIPTPPWGICPVHEFGISPYFVRKGKESGCKIFIHPESPPESQEMADFVGSTSQMIKAIGEIEGKCYLLGTEEGLAYRARKEYPDKDVRPLNERAVCWYMKSLHLLNLKESLERLRPKVEIEGEVAKRVREIVERSIEMVR